jgi:uncharacterized DUF497 family protein
MEDRLDPAKHAANQQKHRLSLAFGERILDDGHHLVLPLIRPGDSEERFKVVGRIGDKMFTGVFVWRGDRPRFISVRRSKNAEESAYRVSG